MARPALIPPQLDGKVFRGSDVVAQGLLTRAQLRGNSWRHLGRDIYADARIPETHGLRIRAAALAMPSQAALGGRSAAWCLGVRYANATEPVDVVVPPNVRFDSGRGIRVRRAALPENDVTTIAGFRITAGERTAWDIACGQDIVEAVVMLDALCARRQVTAAGLAERLELSRTRGGRHHRTRRVQAERAISLMDPRAASPPESRLRVHIVLDGLPIPVPQFEIMDGDIFVARLDLAWPEYRVAVEYDGFWHNATDDRFVFDRQRAARISAMGWRIIPVSARQLSDDLPRLLSDIRRTLVQAVA